MSTAIEETIKNANRQQVIRRNAYMVFAILREFIPRHCEGPAFEALGKWFEECDIELTSKSQRDAYMAVMKLCADGAKYDEILNAGKLNE